MGIESVLPLPLPSTPQSGAGKSSSVLGSESPSMDFLDLILAHIEKNALLATPETGGELDVAAAQAGVDPLLNFAGSDKSLAEFLAANPEIEQEVRNFIDATDLGGDAALLQTLGLNQKAFDDALISSGQISLVGISPEKKDSLSLLQILNLDGTANNKDGTKLLGQLNALKQHLKKIAENKPDAVLTTNLTPEQMTALQNAPEGEWPEELQGLNIILIALVQPQKNALPEATDLNGDPALANALIILTPPQKQKAITAGGLLAQDDVVNTAQDALAGRLNSLMPGMVGEDDGQAAFDDFEATLKALEDSPKTVKASAINEAPAPTKNTPKAEMQAGPGFSALQSTGLFGLDPALYSLPGDSLGLYDDLAIGTAMGSPSHGAALTSIASQAGHASMAHPATQAVAVTIQKNLAQGQPKTIAIDLDPPELGRLEVRLTFDKDKTMKAHVIAEKPETYMMLQRDADTLQRLLQGSGLESEAGLSFELAEHGFDFDQNNQRGGGHDSGGTGAGAKGEHKELIETTMMWRVDPETGHMRYNILA